MLVAGLGHTHGLNLHPLMVRWSCGLLGKVVACPVEVEFGDFDSFDSVLHGKESRGSCCLLLSESDKAKSCCSQLCSENFYPEQDFLKKWKVEREHLRLGNFWGMARKKG